MIYHDDKKILVIYKFIELFEVISHESLLEEFSNITSSFLIPIKSSLK